MEIVTKLTMEEYLRFICASRGVRVKKDSEFAGYRLTSLAGEIGYGFASKEEAFRDFCEDESAVDVRFLDANLDRLTLREGDAVELASGETATVAEIFSKSGLIESPDTKINLADGNEKVFRTVSFRDLGIPVITSQVEFSDEGKENPGGLDVLVAPARSVDLDDARKKSSQFSFNF